MSVVPSMADRDGKIWMDGEMVDWRDAKIHVLTHTLHYGCGAFEGVRAYNTVDGTAIFRLEEHTERLFNSAKILRMKIPFSKEEVNEAQKAVVRANKLESCYLRPLTWIGSQKLGVSPKGNTIHLMVAAWAWGAYLGEEGMKRGIRVKTSSYTRHHVNITMTQAKAVSNYSNSILANMEALDDGYDEALLLDASGFVSEGAGENIFVVKDGVVYTPDLSAGALNGITRNTVFAICADLGLKVVEKRITRDEVYIADEAFFTGTAAEVTPIRELDRLPIGIGSREEFYTALFAVFVKRQFGFGDVVAAMGIADKGLAAVGRPLDVAVELFRGPGQAHVFGIQVDLGAEAATDIRRNHTHLVFGQAQDESAEDQPDDMRILRGGVDRCAVGAGIILADGAARLHRIGRQAVVHQLDLGDMGGRGKGLFRRCLVAKFPVVAQVAGRIGMHLRCAGLECGTHIDHRSQDFVIDFDDFAGIARLAGAARDHHGHQVADISHMVDGDDVVTRCLVWIALLVLDRPAADQPADLVGSHILAGVDGDDTGHLACGIGVDRPDFRERMRRPQEHGVKLTRAIDVICVMALTRNEAEIFLATDCLTDALVCHNALPPHCLCPGHHGLDDVVIARAAAQIAFQLVANGFFARIWIALSQVDRTHDHARRAEAALQGMMFAEGFLHRVQFAVLGEAFDGDYLGTLRLRSEDGTGFYALAVDMDDAGAALAGIAANMGAGELKAFTQKLHQQRARFNVASFLLAVDGDRHGNRHAFLPWSAECWGIRASHPVTLGASRKGRQVAKRWIVFSG